MWNLKRCDKNELIYKTEANSQTYRMEFMVAKWGNWGEEIGSLGLRCMSVKFLSHVRLFATPCSLPGSSVHEIFQIRILERVAISFCRGSSQPNNLTWVSHIAGQRFTI